MTSEYILSACDGKDQLDRKTANRLAQKARRRGFACQPYKCDICGGYHIGRPMPKGPPVSKRASGKRKYELRRQ